MTATGHLLVGAVLPRSITLRAASSARTHLAVHPWGRGPAATRPQLVFVGCRAVRGPGADLVRLVRAWATGRPNEHHLLAEADRAGSEMRRGTDLAAVQRLLFGLLAGASDDDLRRAAHLGGGKRLGTSGVMHRLAGHTARGDTIVLVTDLPDAAVRGDADRLDALVLAPDLPVDPRGRLTGEVLEPMVGAARAAAVTRFAVGRGHPISGCAAIGSSWGDLDLLRAAGSASVAGDHPVLLGLARAERWSIITGGAVDEGRSL